ncbi:MAG: hypothetical protein K0M63_05560 [Weeksellaceae bacterium]|nr:hypothetical protein [Weeksellaceae bacterium]
MKDLLLLTILSLTISTSAVSAQTSETTPCPNPKKLRGLCMFVSSKEEDPFPQGRFVWKYQRKLLEAACINVKIDSEEEIGKKIAKVWAENESTLICNNTKFDVANGSIIKFAVNLKFDEFLIDVTKWKVNLNKVDETDAKTVLDYVHSQIEANKGLATEPVLKRYYQMLKDAGAKHKSEL